MAEEAEEVPGGGGARRRRLRVYRLATGGISELLSFFFVCVCVQGFYGRSIWSS